MALWLPRVALLSHFCLCIQSLMTSWPIRLPSPPVGSHPLALTPLTFLLGTWVVSFSEALEGFRLSILNTAVNKQWADLNGNSNSCHRPLSSSDSCHSLHTAPRRRHSDRGGETQQEKNCSSLCGEEDSEWEEVAQLWRDVRLKLFFSSVFCYWWGRKFVILAVKIILHVLPWG